MPQTLLPPLLLAGAVIYIGWPACATLGLLPQVLPNSCIPSPPGTSRDLDGPPAPLPLPVEKAQKPIILVPTGPKPTSAHALAAHHLSLRQSLQTKQKTLAAPESLRVAARVRQTSCSTPPPQSRENAAGPVARPPRLRPAITHGSIRHCAHPAEIYLCDRVRHSHEGPLPGTIRRPQLSRIRRVVVDSR